MPVSPMMVHTYHVRAGSTATESMCGTLVQIEVGGTGCAIMPPFAQLMLHTSVMATSGGAYT